MFNKRKIVYSTWNVTRTVNVEFIIFLLFLEHLFDFRITVNDRLSAHCRLSLPNKLPLLEIKILYKRPCRISARITR